MKLRPKKPINSEAGLAKGVEKTRKVLGIKKKSY